MSLQHDYIGYVESERARADAGETAVREAACRYTRSGQFLYDDPSAHEPPPRFCTAIAGDLLRLTRNLYRQERSAAGLPSEERLGRLLDVGTTYRQALETVESDPRGAWDRVTTATFILTQVVRDQPELARVVAEASADLRV